MTKIMYSCENNIMDNDKLLSLLYSEGPPGIKKLRQVHNSSHLKLNWFAPVNFTSRQKMKIFFNNAHSY